jgi:hypothetical protein
VKSPGSSYTVSQVLLPLPHPEHEVVMTMEIVPAMDRNLEEGHPDALPEEATLAGSAESGIRRRVQLTLLERPAGAVMSWRSAARDDVTRLLSAASAVTVS